MPLQTNLIAYNSHATETKVWFYYSQEAGAKEDQGKKAAGEEEKQIGPVSKDEIKNLFYKGKVSCLPALAW